MTPLVIKSIWSNDVFEWEAFLAYQSPTPYDECHAFGLTVGVEGEQGGNDFQVSVVTPLAVSGMKQRGEQLHIVVIEKFTPEKAIKAIEDTVTQASGLTWHDGIRRLRKIMLWEYEGM